MSTATATTTTTVLVVDDSALMRKAIGSMLGEAGGFDVHLARNGQDALEQLPRVRPDVVTLDINMPVMDGLTCLAEIMKTRPCPVVMVSSLTERGALATLEALELGAVDYVEKPGGTVALNMREATDELVAKVRRAAGARNKISGLSARLRRNREEAHALSAAPAARTSPARREGASRAATGTADLVVIGSSTGGPALLSDLLSRLPGDFGPPVLVAQHMPRSFTGPLAQRIDLACALSVQEVTGPTAALPGHVYIARGDADMVVTRRSDGLLVRPAPASSAYRWHPSVDRLVQSALDAVDPRRVVGVLLTGMGDDGAEQMTRLAAAGGRTIAESEE